MHIPTDDLYAFLDDDDRVDVGGVHEHLLECAECRERFEDMRAWHRLLSTAASWALPPSLRPARFEPLGIMALSARAAEEDAAADRLMTRLPADDVATWARACAAPEDRTAGLVRRLIREARGRYERVPLDALTILDLAVEIAERLVPRAFSLEGELWKERGNALRHLGRYPEALRALDKADRAYGRVPATTFERAFVLWARATVYWAMKRFDDARALASRAEETFREYGDDVDAARVQVLEGGIRFDEGDIAGARAVFDGARTVIEQFEDEETLARLFANLCTCDLRLGEVARGRASGAHAAALFAKLGMDTEALRLFWSVAEALAVTGANGGAVGQLQQTAAQFERLGMLGVAADVSLDTLQFLLADRRHEEAAHLAASLAARFRTENDAVGAAHAFAYFQEAASAFRATPKLVEYVRFYLMARAAGEDVPFAPSDGMPN